MAAGAVDERNPGSCSGPGDPARQHSFLYATAAKKEPAASERPTALTCFIFEEWPMFTQKRSAATICAASKAKTQSLKCRCIITGKTYKVSKIMSCQLSAVSYQQASMPCRLPFISHSLPANYPHLMQRDS